MIYVKLVSYICAQAVKITVKQILCEIPLTLGSTLIDEVTSLNPELATLSISVNYNISNISTCNIVHAASYMY